MANFVGKKFTFNGETSDSHNVILVKVGESGMVNTSIGGGREVREEYVSTRDIPFFYRGVMNTPRNLSITITLNTPATPSLTWTTAIKADIFAWLYGPRQYCDFISEDFGSDFVEKIIFTSPLELTTADLQNGYVTLSAQALPHRYSPVQASAPIATASPPLTFYVNSLQNVANANGDYYFYPQLNITVGTGVTSFTLTNVTDSSRVFSITGLTAGEKLVIKNDLKIIESDTHTNLVGNLSGHRWFRLLPGVNQITLSTAATVVVTAQYPILG